jgi:hypothetical protein
MTMDAETFTRLAVLALVRRGIFPLPLRGCCGLARIRGSHPGLAKARQPPIDETF